MGELILNPEDGLMFRIIHFDNLEWIIEHGIHCRNSHVTDPRFKQIGLQHIISMRKDRPVPISPYGYLSDYIPFYFTPWSPTLYKVVTGHEVPKVDRNDIVFLVARYPELCRNGIECMFTDRHAAIAMAQFYSRKEELGLVDWDCLNQRDFKVDPENPEKVEKYQAEALVYKHLPLEELSSIACYSIERKAEIKQMLDAKNLHVRLKVDKGIYFK